MVYGGKPSRGCKTCKTRKIKCDEARPECSQCTKSSRTCLGYPDEADLIFRNQNDIVAKRQQRQNEPKVQPSSTQDEQSNPENGSLQISKKRRSRIGQPGADLVSMKSNPAGMVSLRPPPALPIEEQVVQVYFKNFSDLYRNEETVRGILPFLVPMYAKSERNSALRIATRATALCAISGLPGQRQLTIHATQMYSRAILAVAQALQDPMQARSDETLQATLLLSLYESIRASDNTITAWSNHVDGATAIVRARGTEQFENPQSLSLFRAARTNMLTNCIRQEVPPPPFPGENGWMSDPGGGSSFTELTRCAILLPCLLSEAKALLKLENTPENILAMSDLIDKAYDLTIGMTSLSQNLPDSLKPRTIAYINEEPTNPASAEAWLGPVHEYKNVHIATVMNRFRSVCMFSTWIVMDCITWLLPDRHELDIRWQQARYVEQQVIDGICSTIPYLFNWSAQAKTQSSDKMDTLADLIMGLSLVWPLGGCVFSPRVSLNQKSWIWGRLKKISQEGLEQASLLENDVKNTLDSFLNRPLY